jgi:hypothetical protein
MTHLLIVCKDCRREVWMTPREYIKWRCPLCNGYPAVRETRRDVGKELIMYQTPEVAESSGLCSSLADAGAAAAREEICYTAG